MAANLTDNTVTIYNLGPDTSVRHLDVLDAQDAAVKHYRRGDTLGQYDTTDRHGNPLHVFLAVDTTTGHGTVYEFPRTPTTDPSTPDSPRNPDPEPHIAPPAPTGAYAAALALCHRKGAVHAPDHARMAGLCQDVIQTLVGAVSPQLVWEGAMKKGLTAKELLHLCHTDFLAVDDLQWI